jgi:hypothetical protein
LNAQQDGLLRLLPEQAERIEDVRKGEIMNIAFTGERAKLRAAEAHDRAGDRADFHGVKNQEPRDAGNVRDQLQALGSAFHQIHGGRDPGIFFETTQCSERHTIVGTNWIAESQDHCSRLDLLVHVLNSMACTLRRCSPAAH